MPFLASILNPQHSTDITSLFIVVGALIFGIILLVYIYQKQTEATTLRNFSTKFLSLEEKERERLLEKHIKKDGKYRRVAGGVFLNHYDKISKELRENLLKDVIKENIKMIEYPIDELTPVFGNLSLNILERYFDIIPQNLRNEIITKSLPEQGGIGKEMIAEIFVKNFEKFDYDFRNKMLLNLAILPNDNIKAQITKILYKNFDNIPREVSRDVLLQLMESKNKDNINYAMDILFRNFYKIDIFTRDELLTRYVVYAGADKKVLEKFLYIYGKAIINQELKKRIMEFVKLK